MELEAEIVVALIAAGVSIVGALLSNVQVARLEHLRASLQDQSAANKARQDYEYEARKRLYTECEPLLFQLGASAGSIISRVQRIAEASREGHLRRGPGNWLGGEGYFMLSTMYRMLAPHAYARLLQNTLTTVDLTLDPTIRHQFQLAQVLHRSLTDDFELSAIEPRVEYEPNHQDAARLRAQNPAVYRRQGLYSGIRDRAVEALITRDGSGKARCLSYGEFEDEFRARKSPVRESFTQVYLLFKDFQPADHPVLWRILIAQVLVCHELRQAQAVKLVQADSRESNRSPQSRTVSSSSRTEVDPALFAWRPRSEAATDESILRIPFDVGRRYLERALAE